jgi:hypothetical protein
MSRSKPRRLQVVCEGPTDLVVIEAAVRNLLEEEFILEMIQPEEPAFGRGSGQGPHGGGWKGVRSWSQQQRDELGSFSASPALLRADLVILHLDADVASDEEIECEKPCPPAVDTVESLRRVALEWLGETRCPSRLVLCLPSKNTEAWVLAALYPDDPLVQDELECRPEPERRLVGRPERLVRRRSGGGKGYKKQRRRYQEQLDRMAESWPTVQKTCPTAERFHQELVEALFGS